MSNPLKTESISVVSPFIGSKNLKYFLQSLQQQSLDPTRFEVIIVEDGDHGAKEITKLFNAKFSLRLVHFSRPKEFDGHSAGLCRNLGAQMALGEYLVFIDTDCILHPDCLEKHLDVLQSGERVAVCGYASELPASRWGLIREGIYESYEELDKASKVDARTDWFAMDLPNWDSWYSCNSSVSRKIFFEAGCFDESGFRCHDMELAYRLFKSGCEFRYEIGARVIHVEHPRSLHSRFEQRQGWKLLAEKNPELESYIFDRLLESQQYQLEIAGYCEDRFLQIVANLPGLRAGYCWVTSPRTSMADVANRLKDIPYITIQNEEYVKIQLGLHRNCWDYEILIPCISDTLQPVVSVLVPFFNAGERIMKSVSSVFLQSIQQFELILIDDASTDNSVNHLLPFINDPRVRLLSCSENSGLSNALNLGLTHSKAQIIVHLDSDDWLESNALEEICACFNKNSSVGAVYGDAYFHFGDQVAIYRGHQVESYEEYFSYEHIQAPRAYKKECALAVGGWNVADAHSGRYYEDRLMLATLSRNYIVKWLGQLLYHCLYNPESLSRIDPYLIASAKLAILYDQAIKHNYDLAHTFNGGILKGELKPHSAPENTFGWSIIIPFHKNVSLLYFSIKSWLESDFTENEGELIIVDDASGEDLQAIIDLDPSRIKVIRQVVVRGPAHARNEGASAARYEMIFFSDADHIVPPNILSRHAKRHQETTSDVAVVGCVFGRRTFTAVSPGIQKRHKEKLLSILRFSDAFDRVAGALVRGDTIWIMDERAVSNIWAKAQKVSFADYWLARWGEIILEFGDELMGFKHKWTRLSTGSVSMRKEIFSKAGEFDDYLRSMEDWELGIKLQKMGVGIVCAPEAEPLHQVHPVDEERGINNYRAVERLRSQHPGHIEQLLKDESYFAPPVRYFFTPEAIDQYINGRPVASNQAQSERQASADRYCLITFDDGPHPLGTRLILDVLDRHDAKAMFFLLGHQVKRYGDMVKAISGRGHEIGVHSWTHTDSGYLTSTEVTRMLSDTIDAIRETTGKLPKYSRPPYGKLSPSYLSACKKLELTPVGWNVSSEDWGANSERDVIINLASEGVRGKVLLFHDGTGCPEHTAAALDWLLGACKAGDIKPILPDDFASRHRLPQLDVFNPFK